MSEARKPSGSQQAPLIRSRRSSARVKLIGRAIGLLQLAADLLEGASQLSDQPVHELTSAQRALATALQSLGVTPAAPVPKDQGELR